MSAFDIPSGSVSSMTADEGRHLSGSFEETDARSTTQTHSKLHLAENQVCLDCV